MTGARSRAALACALGLALSGCGDAPEGTLLVVEVFTAGLSAGADFDALPVTVRSARTGAELLARSHPVGAGADEVLPPLRFALSPAAGARAEAVVVRAEARLRGELVVAQEAEVAFVPGQRVRLQLLLDAVCAPVRCQAERQTCVAGACVERGRFVTVPFRPGAPLALEDAGRLDDAASTADAGARDAESPDAPTATDVGGTDTGVDAPLDVAGADTGGAGSDALASGCDPADRPDDARSVFVSPSGDDTAGDGTRLRPLRTISAALTVAKATRRPDVQLAPGTYAEAVRLGADEAGVVIAGGWRVEGARWTRDCEAEVASRTVVAGPGVVTVEAADVTRRTGLARLTVTTRSKGGQDGMGRGQSLIGVLVRGAGSVFFLEDVDVLVGEGGNGLPAPPAPPTPAAMCHGVNDCGGGMPGLSGTRGANAGAGTFTANGFVPALALPGVNGTTGSNGSAGGPGMSMDGCNWGCSSSSGCDSTLTTRVTAGQGRCGCGGGGGAGGPAGRSGGASIALFVSGVGAAVSVTGGRLSVAGGGAGSAGAAGAPPSEATPGRMGNDAVCATGGCSGTVQACYYVNQTTLRGGSAGGPGYAGGRGGDGGHGAGGPAIAIVRAANARVLLERTAPVTLGPGGSAPSGALRGQSAVELSF